MPNLTLQDWEREFRTPAGADLCGIFRDHLRFLELPGKAISMMEATVLMVHASAACYTSDGRSCDDFLAMQKYDPAQSPDTRYAFTFDLYGRAYARLLVGSEIHAIDLADLCGHPWEPYRTVGYSQIWISHTDRTDLTKEEMAVLDKQVTRDLRYDYAEDELGFWFDDSNAKYLYAYVYEPDRVTIRPSRTRQALKGFSKE
jgi:hypothetical protein